jgi:DNA-directed RNA polymerase specialized sigma24 family protein
MDRRPYDPIEANAAAATRLRRLLGLDRQHALHFVVVSPHAEEWQAKRLVIEALSSDFRLYDVWLDPDTDAPITNILEELPGSCFSTPEHPGLDASDHRIVFVWGLTDVLSAENRNHVSALINLNAERDRLRELRTPTVFWVSERVLDTISRSLPDLWSWASSVTHFWFLTPEERARELHKDRGLTFAQVFLAKGQGLRNELRASYPILSEDDVEDAVQDAFLAAQEDLQHLPVLPGISKEILMYPVLKRAARRCAKAIVRDRVLTEVVPTEAMEGIGTQGYDPNHADPGIGYEVAEALESLPETEAEVLRLRTQGATVADISGLLGLPRATVVRRLNIARRLVYQFLERRGQQDGG